MKKTTISDELVLEKETSSRIKIEKNSKGYNYEASVDYDRHEEGALDKAIAELEKIDSIIKVKFKSE